MIVTALGKGTGGGPLYPEFIGRRGLFVGTATGPASYANPAGDPVSLAISNYYIDAPFGDALTVSGNYLVQFKPAGLGTRQKWTAIWVVVSTGQQVANGVNLSAEQLQPGFVVGQF